MDRRGFIHTLASGLLAAPLAAEAQRADGIARIGWLTLNLATPANPRVPESFLERLRALGYVEGRNVLVEYRGADGKPERFPADGYQAKPIDVTQFVAAVRQVVERPAEGETP